MPRQLRINGKLYNVVADHGRLLFVRRDCKTKRPTLTLAQNVQTFRWTLGKCLDDGKPAEVEEVEDQAA